MNPAKNVVDKFGGQSALAKMLGKRPGTVQYWVKTGHDPLKTATRTIESCKEALGVNLQPREFIADSSQSEAVAVRKSWPPEAKYKGFLNLLDMDIPAVRAIERPEGRRQDIRSRNVVGY